MRHFMSPSKMVIQETHSLRAHVISSRNTDLTSLFISGWILTDWF